MARNKNRKMNNDHSFWCIKCGQRGIPLFRSEGSRKEKFHEKKLYCLHCKEEMNHVECCTAAEIEEFNTAFKNGAYLQEVKDWEAENNE